MEYKDITFEISDPQAVITLNRPDKLNAFTFDTLDEIYHAVGQAVAAKSVVGIIITGSGRGFCAGLDSASLSDATGNGQTHASYQKEDNLPGLFSYFTECPKPIITAINGVAAGGGLVMTLLSDVRIAARSASFTTVFLKRGLVAEHGSSWTLPRLVGTGRALDLLFTSDRITAEQAHEFGLVQKLVEDEILVETAKQYVQTIAASAAPEALAASKRMVYGHAGSNFNDALRQAETIQNRFVKLGDAAEGAAALAEKRAPKFERIGE
ncbi:MAG: enoyl-CoA hydratase-related protein [Pseudomonadota bacterium]